MSDDTRVEGNTTIDSDVIETIIKMTASETEGVSHLFITSSNTGVKTRIQDGIVTADVYVVLAQRQNAVLTSRKLQEKISRAISEMVGMKAGNISIHVEDYDYSTQTKIQEH